MRINLLISAALVLCAVALITNRDHGKAAENQSAASSGPAIAAKNLDVTAEVRKYNSDQFSAPPSKFRKGHVKPRKLDPKAHTKQETGFSIKLPSGAPIATPAIYNGKVYVSGGFHSKEFYCFHAKTGQLVWALDLDDDGPSSAVCEDGVTVFNTESCTIFAVDSETGEQLWSHWLGDPLTSTPTISDGKVFTSYPANGGGGLQQGFNNPAANAQQANPPVQIAKPAKKKTGKPRPPYTHVLAAFDLKSGKILWQRWIDSDVMSAPIAVGKELYATSFSGVVYRFDQKTGKILSATKSRATSAPVVVGGEVFLTQRGDSGRGPAIERNVKLQAGTFSSVKGFTENARRAEYIDPKVQGKSMLAQKGLELDASNGFAGGAPAAANPQAAGDNIGQMNVSTMQAFQGSRFTNYGGRNFNCPGNEILCTNPTDGTKVWSVKIKGDLKKQGGFLAAPPVAAGGQLFVATLAGEVLQLDPKTGKVNARYRVGGPIRSQPVVEGGRIFVGTQDGKVVCLNTQNPKYTGWPMWGKNAAHTAVQNVD